MSSLPPSSPDAPPVRSVGRAIRALPVGRAAWRGVPRLPAGIALIVLCLLGMVAIPYWSAGESAKLRERLSGTLTPLELVTEHLQVQALAMANEVTGFLLTGDGSFLATFETRAAAVRSAFERGEELAERLDPEVERHLLETREAYEAWLRPARLAMARERIEGRTAGEAQERSGSSARQLGIFLAQGDEMAALLRQREETVRQRLHTFEWIERLFLPILGALAVVVVGYLAWLALALLRAQTEMLEERDQLQAVLASVDSGIVLFDRDRRVLVANTRVRELLGLPHAIAEAEHRAHVAAPLKPRTADPDGFEKRLAYLYENPDAVAEDLIELVEPPGRTLARFSSPVRDETGSVFGRIEVYRDVTDALRRERELAEANERKDHFMATLSHELRTPLTPIFGWIELLENERDPRTIATGLAAIRRNASLEAQLVEDLLDLSRVVNQKLELDFRTVDVSGAIQSALETVRHLAEAKQVRLETRVQDPPLRVRADETRFIQVLWNLLSNAIKFSAAGGRVVVSARDAGERLTVTVEDEGQGIAPDQLEHIFKPFEQGQNARNRGHGGLGIGLALARSLVELHGGGIRADSEGPGRGARFTFWIPLRVPEGRSPWRPEDGDAPETEPLPVEGSAAGANADAWNGGSGAVRGRPERARAARILVVEDNPDTLEAMRVLLSSWGYEVLSRSDVGSALESVSRDVPDVVISDIAMPHVDGLAFAREVRGREAGGEARAALVAITGFASREDRRQALAAGFDAYLTKPIDFESLRALLERLVSVRPDSVRV